MKKHPSGLKSIEDRRREDPAQEGGTSLIDPPHVSEVTQPLIHIETGVSLYIGRLISRLKRVLFGLAFRAVYTIAF